MRNVVSLSLCLLLPGGPALAQQSTLKVAPSSTSRTAITAARPAAAASELRTAPLMISRLSVEALPPSRVQIAPLSDSPETVILRPREPLPASAIRVAALESSRARIDPLPVSRTRIEPLAASATTKVEQLRSELNARETERGTLISLPGDVLFDFDRWEVRRDARPTLAKLAELIQLTPDVPVTIAGHTDAKGSEAYNRQLSLKRARSVTDWLVERHGIERGRLREEGHGEAMPVAPNAAPDGSDDPAGRQRNRRVEVVLPRHG